MTQVVQNVLLHLWLTINDWVSFEWSTHTSLLSLVDLGPRFILPTLPISCVEKDKKDHDWTQHYYKYSILKELSCSSFNESTCFSEIAPQ